MSIAMDRNAVKFANSSNRIKVNHNAQNFNNSVIRFFFRRRRRRCRRRCRHLLVLRLICFVGPPKEGKATLLKLLGGVVLKACLKTLR